MHLLRALPRADPAAGDPRRPAAGRASQWSPRLACANRCVSSVGCYVLRTAGHARRSTQPRTPPPLTPCGAGNMQPSPPLDSESDAVHATGAGAASREIMRHRSPSVTSRCLQSVPRVAAQTAWAKGAPGEAVHAQPLRAWDTGDSPHASDRRVAHRAVCRLGDAVLVAAVALNCCCLPAGCFCLSAVKQKHGGEGGGARMCAQQACIQ